MIYLDTHVVSWLYQGELAKLSKTARRRLDSGEDLVISPIVVLELQFLFEIGRVTRPARQVLAYLKENLGLQECQKPFSRVVEAARAQTWTRDPFDRIIAGQASLDQDILLTQDETMRKHYRRAAW